MSNKPTPLPTWIAPSLPPGDTVVLNEVPVREQVLKPIGYRTINLERVAARYGLTFHIDCYDPNGGSQWSYGQLTEHRGWKSETREATDEELEMWRALLPGDFNPELLPATIEEIRKSFEFRGGPFTINAIDLVPLMRHIREMYEPCVDRKLLLQGFVGWYKGKGVYVSRHIMPGFFLEGPRMPELWYRPNPEEPRQVATPIPNEVVWKVESELIPFKL